MALMDTLGLWLQPGKNEVSQRFPHSTQMLTHTPLVSLAQICSQDQPPVQRSAALSASCQLLSILTSALSRCHSLEWRCATASSPPPISRATFKPPTNVIFLNRNYDRHLCLNGSSFPLD